MLYAADCLKSTLKSCLYLPVSLTLYLNTHYCLVSPEYSYVIDLPVFSVGSDIVCLVAVNSNVSTAKSLVI